jgi:hypothetical protein
MGANGESTMGLKEKYNSTLMRYYKAAAYLNSDKPYTEREKWISEAHKITLELGSMLEEFKNIVVICSEDEIIGGFSLDTFREN